MRPNVLIVVLDAARRDALEPYGAPAGSTPAIAQLASRGTALPEVYATGCWTMPSHASFFTGLMPRAAGLAQLPSPSVSKPILAEHAERLLPAVMRDAGYATGAVSANLWISEASGFDAGFDDFTSVFSSRPKHFGIGSPRKRVEWLVAAARARSDDGAAAAWDALERGMADRTRRPFFWFVNLIECHSPYLPPRPHGNVSLLDRLRASRDARRYYTLDAIWRACAGGFEVPEDTLERMRRLYRGSIRLMDDWLARLLELLDGSGALDDTTVIVLSDHGENFGEGGLLTHSMSLDERLIHVPLVLAGPGTDGAAITSLARLPQFVAGVAGIDDHPWREELPEGFGLAQFDPPSTRDDPKLAAAVERWGLGDEALDAMTTPLTAAVRGDLKLVDRGGREEVYDLAADPLELNPLAPAEVRAEREAELAGLREALRHPAMTARRAAPAGEPSVEEAADIEERMKLLGYM